MGDFIKDLPSNAILRVILTSFLGAHVSDVEGAEGVLEKCVCIPIEKNNLSIGPTGRVSAYMFVTKTRNANQYGWTHYLKLKAHTDFVRKMNALGYEMPYLGNIKPAKFVVNKNSYYNSLSGKKVKVKDYE